jgi:hypothetical protein
MDMTDINFDELSFLWDEGAGATNFKKSARENLRFNFEDRMLDVGCWMLDVGCWMLDVGSSQMHADLSLMRRALRLSGRIAAACPNNCVSGRCA